MKTTDFFYELPPELIAQTPCEQRDGSRMLYLPLDGGPAIVWCLTIPV